MATQPKAPARAPLRPIEPVPVRHPQDRSDRQNLADTSAVGLHDRSAGKLAAFTHGDWFSTAPGASRRDLDEDLPGPSLVSRLVPPLLAAVAGAATVFVVLFLAFG
jgi:hypothetical protein